MPSPDRESSGGYPWEATPGKHVLMTRATDKKGETQPDTVPFNELGSTATSCRASRSRCSTGTARPAASSISSISRPWRSPEALTDGLVIPGRCARPPRHPLRLGGRRRHLPNHAGDGRRGGAPGVFIVPLQEEFGWQTAEISSALAIRLALFGLLGPFAAAFMNRFGVRRMVLIALAIIAAGDLARLGRPAGAPGAGARHPCGSVRDAGGAVPLCLGWIACAAGLASYSTAGESFAAS